MKKWIVLRKRQEFVKVAEQGKRFVTPTVVLQFLDQPNEDFSTDVIRVGFTTTKKIGIAVRRNRVRRRLREAARQILPIFGKEGACYVLIGRAGTFDASFQTILADLKKAVQIIERIK